MEYRTIGKIRTSHGIRGEVKTLSHSGEWEHFLELDTIELELNGQRKPYRVETARKAQDTVLLKLWGVDTPEAAKLLAGAEIWVKGEQAAPLGEGEYYLADLVGLRLMDNGVHRADVCAYTMGSQGPLLEVRPAEGGKSILVPFIRQYFGEIKLEQGSAEFPGAFLLE